MSRAPIVLPLLLVAASTGCATLAPRAQLDGLSVKHFGEVQQAREKGRTFTHSMRTALQALEPAQVGGLQPSVTILEGSLPRGVSVADGIISTAPESGYTAVGMLQFAPRAATSAWFHDYSSPGRKAWCYWQVPLTWATLVMWQIFVPLSWPCVAPSRVPLEEGYGYLRQAAHAAGADTLILTDVHKTDQVLFGAKGVLLRRTDGVPREEDLPRNSGAWHEPQAQ